MGLSAGAGGVHMHEGMVCPYYGKNDDLCDVGCGYISPHDVQLIIKHCSSHYQACPKFGELDERSARGRIPVQKSAPPQESPPRQASAGLTTSPPSQPYSSAPPLCDPPPSGTGINPWGLFALGLNTLLLSLFQVGSLQDAGVAGTGIFYGGLWQVMVGLTEWNRRNTFGVAAFTSYGLFWLSLLAMLILPGAGWGLEPNAASMAAYLVMWTLFSALLLMGAKIFRRPIRAVFAVLTLYFLLFALSSLTGSTLIGAVAGYLGVAGGSFIVLVGLTHGLTNACGQKPLALREIQKSH